ncbi:MAG: hypothetical protein BGP07_14510 [Rhizobiales bacterium 63-22]|nr:MAG: hypothetical protein BGP07_14510 [Rhizobiales bacterium 63-22]
MDHDEERRKRAYEIWENEGRPEGHHLEHWQRAGEQLEAAKAKADQPLEPEAPVKKPARARKTKSIAKGTR